MSVSNPVARPAHPLSAVADAIAGRGIPDRPDAVTIGERSMSRAELAGRAETFAARIAGAPAVAVRAEASMSTVIAVVGGMLAGVPVVPLPPDAGADETAYMLADSGAALYVADTDTAGSPVPVALDAPRPR
jgi:fatty acid CoA ligase FadD36